MKMGCLKNPVLRRKFFKKTIEALWMENCVFYLIVINDYNLG